MNKTKYHVKITFITPALGSQAAVDVVRDYIHPGLSDDEAAALPLTLEKATTVFHKNPIGQPLLWDYHVKGFLKNAARVFNGLQGVKALQSKVINLVFVEPRQFVVHLPEGAVIDYKERPIQTQTAQGPRTALARSEQIPIGSWFECDIQIYDGPITGEILRDLLTYGADCGMCQWRTGGWGKFTFEIV